MKGGWELVSVHDALILPLAGWLITCVSVRKAYANLTCSHRDFPSLRADYRPTPTRQHSSHSGADHAAVWNNAYRAALLHYRPFGPRRSTGGRPRLGA